MAGDGLIRELQTSQTEPIVLAMGGDVTGTTAASVVAQIRGTLVDAALAPGAGEVLKWDGAKWASVPDTANSWDGIYANDQTLDIDGVVLTFDQSATSGFGFTVSRNLALGSTDSPIMLVANLNSGDDQAALNVIGGIADVVDTVPVLHVAVSSAGMATGVGNISYGVQSEVVPHAGDAGGSLLESFHATITGAGTGAATVSAFRADAGFDYGLYSDSPIYAEYTFGVGLAEMDQMKLVSASPAAGLGGAGAVAVMQKFEYTPDSDDVTDSTIIGSWYNMTAAPEADVPSVAIFIGDVGATSSWAQGIVCYSPGNSFQYTGACGTDTGIINVTVDPSNLLSLNDYLKGVTVTMAGNAGDNPGSNYIGIQSRMIAATAGDSIAFKVEDALWKKAFVSEGGLWEIDINDATNGFIVGQSGAGKIFELKDGTATGGVSRVLVNESGATDFDIEDAANGVRIANTGAGNLFQLIDGAISGGTQRFLVIKGGVTTINTANDVGTAVLELDQNDEDQAFIDYQGVIGVDNTTSVTSFTGGTGAVVGPTGQAVAEAHFTHAGMIMIEVAGSTYWQPYFEYHAA